MNVHEVIRAPLMTEKTEAIKSAGKGVNRYTVRVHPEANKELIRQALHKIYKVKASKVNIINVPGKLKRFRYDRYKQPSWKKAIITLEAGQELKFGK
jgi:large subunit ribosomal protein L23